MKNLNLLLLALVYVSGFSQDISAYEPLSWSLSETYKAPIEIFEGVPYRELSKEDAVNDLDKSIPWRFGYEFATDLDPATAGETVLLPNGDQLWRVRIQSPGAYTINLLFDWYQLIEGASVRIYSNDRSDVSKLYTHEQNNEQQILGIWPIASDDIWVEFIEPAASVGQSRFSIGTVVHGYRNITESDDFKALNDSGACNQDVNCDITPNGADPFMINQVKENVKKSGAMIVLGSGVCSGALVNNATEDKKPYFLTANHCLGTNSGSWAFRFNWRSTIARCASTQPSVSGTFNETASGANLLMSSDESDTALVEITDTGFFNGNPDVVWAGWNRSTSMVPSLNFGIHHPSGDIQKVCRYDQGAVRETRFFNGNPSTQMWLISDWDLGVTEPGSSGSPLFNENGEIIGVLAGGAAACFGTTDNNQIDYYGRFGIAWNFGSSASSRLKDWLDPNNTEVTRLDSFPRTQPSDPDTTDGLEINIYPNPSEGLFNIIINQRANFTVFDLSGKLIQEGSLNTSSNLLNLSVVSDGLYLLNIETDSGTTTKKLIKN